MEKTTLALAAPFAERTVMDTILNVGFAIILIVGLVLLAWMAIRLAGGWGKLEQEYQEDEHSFEAEALKQISAPAPAASSRGYAADFASPPPVLGSVQVHPPPPPLPVAPVAPAPAQAGTVEDLAGRLFALRVVQDREGRITLGAPPEGLIYRLRSGGSAGLLPRLEAAEVMEHQCRRFDMVFALTPSGEVLVVQRLQTRLPELIDSPTDYGKA